MTPNTTPTEDDWLPPLTEAQIEDVRQHLLGRNYPAGREDFHEYARLLFKAQRQLADARAAIKQHEERKGAPNRKAAIEALFFKWQTRGYGQHAGYLSADDIVDLVLDAALSSTPSPAVQEPQGGWEHLKGYGYAPGNYMSRCHSCCQVVSGLDKRAMRCRPCAEAAAAAPHPTEERKD
jgi:hypothetical protein